MPNIINLLQNKKHTCPWWLCFTFDNPIRKLFHNPLKILDAYIKKGDSILDLGPGMGYFTIPLCVMTGNDGVVYAADIQSKMLELVERRAKRNNVTNLKTYLIKDDLDINSCFDFILAFWMFHEVYDKEHMLTQLHSKLKNTGRLLIVEPKIHVTKKHFDNEIKSAEAAGFGISAYPAVPLSRAALFTKKTT
jgi:ubiquinone/menaquinone biosynthesis C-methylase UbiE